MSGPVGGYVRHSSQFAIENPFGTRAEIGVEFFMLEEPFTQGSFSSEGWRGRGSLFYFFFVMDPKMLEKVGLPSFSA